MLLFLLISFMACVLVYKSSWFQVAGLPPSVTLTVFILKCIIGFFLLWLYGHFIEIDRADADVFKYFDDALILHSSAKDSLRLYWELFSGTRLDSLAPYFEAMHNWDSPRAYIHSSDNRTMIRIHSVLLFISQGDIRIHQVVFALLSMLGLVTLFKGLSTWSKMPGWAFLAVCVLPPSLLFWGSGLLKETIVMLPLGLFIYGLTGWNEGRKKQVAMLLGMLAFIWIKPYIGMCLLPGLSFLIADKKIQIPSFWLAIGSVIVMILLLFLATYIPGFDPIGRLAAEQIAFIELAQAKAAGSLIAVHQFDDLWSFLVQSPGAALRCIFRPVLWEIRGPLDTIAAIENTGYILLVLAAMIYRKKGVNMRPIYFSILSVLAIAVLIGSVTPVLGAVVRYKAPMLPFLVFVFFHLIDLNRIPLIRTFVAK